VSNLQFKGFELGQPSYQSRSLFEQLSKTVSHFIESNSMKDLGRGLLDTISHLPYLS
jgi:hypothetical protein